LVGSILYAIFMSDHLQNAAQSVIASRSKLGPQANGWLVLRMLPVVPGAARRSCDISASLPPTAQKAAGEAGSLTRNGAIRATATNNRLN
jgi:hypothetical protein